MPTATAEEAGSHYYLGHSEFPGDAKTHSEASLGESGVHNARNIYSSRVSCSPHDCVLTSPPHFLIIGAFLFSLTLAMVILSLLLT